MGNHYDERELYFDEPLPADIKAKVLEDLAEYVEKVHEALRNDTFKAAVFAVLVDKQEEDGDGNPQGHVSSYRHGFASGLSLLVADTVERYAATIIGDTQGGMQ